MQHLNGRECCIIDFERFVFNTMRNKLRSAKKTGFGENIWELNANGFQYFG